MTMIIKSQRLRFHVRCEKFLENCSRKNTKSRYHLKDLGLDERASIKRVFKRKNSWKEMSANFQGCKIVICEMALDLGSCCFFSYCTRRDSCSVLSLRKLRCVHANLRPVVFKFPAAYCTRSAARIRENSCVRDEEIIDF